MERHFKALLIDRSQKQFQLTREGLRVYEAAKEVLRVLRGEQPLHWVNRWEG